MNTNRNPVTDAEALLPDMSLTGTGQPETNGAAPPDSGDEGPSPTNVPPGTLDRAEFDRRRRHRALVTGAILFAMVFLFYFITIARLQR